MSTGETPHDPIIQNFLLQLTPESPASQAISLTWIAVAEAKKQGMVYEIFEPKDMWRVYQRVAELGNMALADVEERYASEVEVQVALANVALRSQSTSTPENINASQE